MIKTYLIGILVFEVNYTREQKIIEEKRENKFGDEREIAERPESELSPTGNSMAQVDRASTYSDPDKDKQFYAKGSKPSDRKEE